MWQRNGTHTHSRSLVTDRRQFLKTAGAAVAAPYVITSSALGAEGRPPASDRLVMAGIGVGNQGSGDLGAFLGATTFNTSPCAT